MSFSSPRRTFLESPSTRAAVTIKVTKDLVKFPIPEIERYLSE